MQREFGPGGSQQLLGCHRQLLTGLAAEAVRRATTVLSDADARRAIASVERTLEETGQLRPARRQRVGHVCPAHLCPQRHGPRDDRSEVK